MEHCSDIKGGGGKNDDWRKNRKSIKQDPGKPK